MAKERAARSTQVRKPRVKEWKEPNELDVPETLREALLAEGCKPRFIRVELDGKPDSRNVMTRHREGYEFVSKDFAEANGWVDPPSMDYGKHGNIVVIGDLALAKLPVEISESRDEQMQAKAQAQIQAVNRQLYENARLNSMLPIQNSSRSQVTGGGSKAVEFDPEE